MSVIFDLFEQEEKEDVLTHVQVELDEKKKEEARKQTEQISSQEKAERCKQINAWKVHLICRKLVFSLFTQFK